MHLERRTVSRKTPRDGKLEISRAAAARLESLTGALSAAWDGSIAPARVVTLSCSCGGASERHDHYFLESEIFRALPVGRDVEVALESGVVQVAVTPSS